MEQPILRPVAVAASLLLAAIAATPGIAQAPPPAQGQLAQQPVAPPKPYKPVTITLPPAGDASLETFRKQLAEVAQRRDRAALAALVVKEGFFWERENGDGADRKKSGIDNLAAALGLDNKDGSGWHILADYAGDPTATPIPGKPDWLCSPGDPAFNDADLEALAKATETDIGEWGYPLRDGVEVRDSAMPNAKVVDKLGLHFVRVMPDESPLTAASSLLRIVLPSGKVGFVSADLLAPLGLDQLCYVKDKAGWKITGYIGEGPQQ